ncbi:MAG TPA: ABC transporter permease subunit [Marinagarivorans sp.]
MKMIWTVFKKEWLDTRRDIKGVLPILIMPLLFALTSYGVLNFVAAMQQDKPEFTLPVMNGDQAAPLLAALHEAGLKTTGFSGDPIAQVREGEVPMVLRIPDSFSEQFREQQMANIELIWDLSRNEHQATANRVKSVVARWYQTLGAQRLIFRGVSPQAAHVGQVVDVNTAREQQMAMRILGSVPLFLVLVAFIACAGVATEMAAGEREGRTLETLLMVPIAKHWLFAGKWLMACSLSMVVVTLALFGQFMAIKMAPTAELGLRIDVSLQDYLQVFVLLVPLVALANSLLLFISLRARSLKDSQTYTQLVTLLPTATGLYVLLSGKSTSLAIAAIPLLGSQALITDALSGLSLSAGMIALNALTCLMLAAGFAFAGVSAFKLR